MIDSQFHYVNDLNATKNVYFYAFSPCDLRMWNKLPQDIKERSSFETFKDVRTKMFYLVDFF